MVSQNSEFTRKLRGAVRAKIEEYGIEVDDELPDYVISVMILVGNKKDKARMKSDLKLFLGDNTSDFVEWLFGFFQKVKASGTGSQSQPAPKEKSETIEETMEEKRKPNADKIPAETHSQKKSSSKQQHKAPAEKRSKADSKELRSSKSSHDRNRKEQKQRPADEASNKKTTIKPILRSVVVQPLSIHPRIRPRSPSPAPIVICSELAPDDERDNKYNNFPAVHVHKAIENEEQPKRRVVATSSGSMLFQRARALIQTDHESKLPTDASHKELNEAKKKQLNEPENEMVEAPKEKDIEKQRAGEDTALTTVNNETKQEQQQTRMPLAPKMKGRKGPPIVGIGAIFQRAIQQTQNQDEPIKGGIKQQQVISEKRKRIFDNEQINMNLESTSKKIRIEFEEIEEQQTEKMENNEGSVLIVNMSRQATRSIRKESKKPKSGLTSLKEHMGVAEELTVGKMVQETDTELPVTNEKEQRPLSSAQNPNVTINFNSTVAAPLWNDQFKIDDMSSTDDEAEIDAVLEEQHKLKQMALERESELKGRELPPTSALTRPMHYNEIPSVQVQPLLSPGEADLLPATFHQQNLTTLSQFNPKPQLSIMTRPFATVAPCSTTAAAPITMIMHQQYQQQNQNFLPQQFVYNVSSGPAIYMPIPQRENLFGANNGPAMTGKGPLAKNGPDEKLRQLREQHKQMVLKYSKSLEEQRLILAQIKKMSRNPQAEQTVQTLKFRCKKMDAITKEMKKKLETLNEEINSLTKPERNAFDSQQIVTTSTDSLQVKRFF